MLNEKTVVLDPSLGLVAVNWVIAVEPNWTLVVGSPGVAHGCCGVEPLVVVGELLSSNVAVAVTDVPAGPLSGAKLRFPAALAGEIKRNDAAPMAATATAMACHARMRTANNLGRRCCRC